jgi:hypothetical protein
MLYAHATIHVGGQTLAAVTAGEILDEAAPPADRLERLSELAVACALPVADLQQAYAAVPRLDAGRLNKMPRLLRILGVAACRISSERRRLLTKLERISKITMEQ